MDSDGKKIKPNQKQTKARQTETKQNKPKQNNNLNKSHSKTYPSQATNTLLQPPSSRTKQSKQSITQASQPNRGAPGNTPLTHLLAVPHGRRAGGQDTDVVGPVPPHHRHRVFVHPLHRREVVVPEVGGGGGGGVNGFNNRRCQGKVRLGQENLPVGLVIDQRVT